MASSLPLSVIEKLQSAGPKLRKARTLVGFDGFVDTILHVVARRESATKYQRMEKMSDFAAKIGEAAGLSANFEFVTQMVKLGGNGPIMANALATLGAPVTYIGNLGAPNLHPVFAGLAGRATIHSIAEPGFTDAIEFAEGKLMFGKHGSLKDVNWSRLTKHLPEERLLKIFSTSSLIALVNWTMLPHMTEIWRNIASRIAPRLPGEKRWIFFDLADPAKRSRADLTTALGQIAKFEKYSRVILGMNLQESRQVGEALGFAAPEEDHGAVTQHAAQIRAALKIHTVVIHPTRFAAAADGTGSTHVLGAFTAKPKITTGAGDHFNAGFCLGRLLGLDLAESLRIGVTTSGFYVRQARSPRLDDLKKFLRSL